MNYGYTNNNYYSGNDCGCATPYEDDSYSSEETCCNTRRESCGNCGILLFIIAIILIFWD